MKINELLGGFEIFTTNEEMKLLAKLDAETPLQSFPERQRFVIENLIKKSLVSKKMRGTQVMVIKNDISEGT
tara:strand:- start:274 stop:489 length:216 start_codon:yes stop_codon:yes gene_type:complete